MPDEAGTKLLADAAQSMKFSARAYHRILKVARSIADLEMQEQINRLHIAEAIALRTPGKQLAIAA